MRMRRTVVEVFITTKTDFEFVYSKFKYLAEAIRKMLIVFTDEICQISDYYFSHVW